MTAPGKPRKLWTPARRTASRAGDCPRMYAFVIRISARNRSARSFAGMIERFGLTTGRSTGVDTDPCAVSIRPIRASPSRSRISNTRGHQSAANKAFRRLRGPLRKGFLRRAIPMARMLRETFVHVPGVGYRTEERLWRMGIRTWDDFSAAGRPRRLSLKLGRRIEDELARSSEALHRGRHRYFARGLSPRDHWRAWREYDAGDDDALDLLLEDNREDVANLEPLAELAYEGLRSLCLDGGFVTADRLPPPR